MIVKVKKYIYKYSEEQKLMRFFLNSLMVLLISLFYGNTVHGMSNYQIKAICQKKQKKSACVKSLKLKKLKLLEGNKIEIPVVPFKK